MTGQVDSRAGVDEPSPAQGRLGAFGAVGGVVGGVLASSCCILPLALVSIGVGGARMPSLTALAPYQPYFLTLAGLSLSVGFWRVYRPSQKTVCHSNGYCANPLSGRVTKTALWLGAALVLAAVAVNGLAPYLI